MFIQDYFLFNYFSVKRSRPSL